MTLIVKEIGFGQIILIITLEFQLRMLENLLGGNGNWCHRTLEKIVWFLLKILMRGNDGMIGHVAVVCIVMFVKNDFTRIQSNQRQ